jgi:hypothetical protein
MRAKKDMLMKAMTCGGGWGWGGGQICGGVDSKMCRVGGGQGGRWHAARVGALLAQGSWHPVHLGACVHVCV